MKYLNSIISSSVGNILEWYDFGLFTLFSALFSRLFFPATNPQVGLIITIGIFTIGFLCRPIGAIIFGYLGDRYGRARTLRLSILMISLPTLLIGCIPTYQTIGIYAPLLLLLIRMWQGVSIGGEYSGNFIYLAESAPDEHRAIFTSFAGIGANLGILLATLVGIGMSTYLKPEVLDAWGWRIPYLGSGILSLLIYFFRLQLKETRVFDYYKSRQTIATNPIKILFTHNWRQLLRTIGLVFVGTSFYFFSFVYLPIYLGSNAHASLKQISTTMSFAIGFMILIIPMAAWLSDKIGRRKLLLFNSILIATIVIPGFYFLQANQSFYLFGIMFLFSAASSFEQGVTPIAVIENFPPPARYTGVSLGYNLGNGILGGTVPFICEWLKMNVSWQIAPACYIAICALVTVVVVYFFVPETKNKSLIDS